MRALSITVTSTVLRASFVAGRVGRGTTIGLHLGEVQSSVQPARKLRDINVESEFLVEQLEHLVLAIGAVHEIDTRPNVGRELALRDELVLERGSPGGDTIGARIVRAFKSAVLCARLGVGAVLVNPVVSIVAVRITIDVVEPAPVGIEHNGASNVAAGALRGTPLPGELRVGLLLQGANLLASDGNSEEGKSDEDGFREHDWTGRGRIEVW